MTIYTKVNQLYDRFSDKIDGLFHNDLWQIIVNETIKADGQSAFIYVHVGKGGGQAVGIATRGEGGYIPLNFTFKPTVKLDERREIIQYLNKEVFGLTPGQAEDIELSSLTSIYKKPMKKAGRLMVPPPPAPPETLKIHNYEDVAGKILITGNSVLVALQVRLGDTFGHPTLHRVPSTKIARIVAQFHANIVGYEIRATFPIEDVLFEKFEEKPKLKASYNWIAYIERLNGEYFRPK